MPCFLKTQVFYATLLSYAFSSGFTYGEPIPVRQVDRTASLAPHFSFADIVGKVSPGVVNIQVFYERLYVHPFFADPFFRSFFNLGDSVPAEKVQEQSVGSGTIVSKNGIVLTCAHVVEGGSKIIVHLKDGNSYTAKVIFSNREEDLAFLQLEGIEETTNLTVVELGDSEKVREGDWAIAIGYPNGEPLVTAGIISSKKATLKGRSVLKTQAELGPGNSGGALINMEGKLIAVPNAILAKLQTLTKHGFAIPAAVASKYLKDSGKNGTIREPWHGLTVDTLSKRLNESSIDSSRQGEGVIVRSLHPKSPAIKKGLTPGSVITKINGQVVKNMSDFHGLMDTFGVGDIVRLSLKSNGEEKTVDYIVVEKPHTQLGGIVTLKKGPLAGLTLSSLTSASRHEYKIPSDLRGVVVTRIAEGSTVRTLGIQEGDVIQRMNGQDIASPEDIEKINTDRHVSLLINRQGVYIETAYHFGR